jgi:UDP-2,3-diacylglucosamine pyrophosphatase LpxH
MMAGDENADLSLEFAWSESREEQLPSRYLCGFGDYLIHHPLTLLRHNRMVAAQPYDTLILSDLHLGADMSRAREAIHVLQENQYRRLVLLGDIFADLNFGRLKKEHWKFLGYIRKLSNPKRKIEVVWVEGNHDHGLAEIMSHLVGVRVYQEYSWEYQGIRHIAVHGHQFDGFSVNNVNVSYFIGTLFYLQLQKWDSKNKTLTRFLDRLNTRWLRLSPKVADGALAHARHHQAGRIFCGHTHAAMHKELNGIDYYNCGAWIDEHCTYITVGEAGVEIHEYEARPETAAVRDEKGAELEAADLFADSYFLEGHEDEHREADHEFEGAGF